ncbi:cold shock domain-containing protein [Nocardia sp. NPDC019255]|uniref:cold shock domain-containing protein n=1 Tax=Nocardia sp. NPDC019255 TaxID=3154591 RepID=UPI0033F005A2
MARIHPGSGVRRRMVTTMSSYVSIDAPDLPGLFDAIDTPSNCEITVAFVDMRNGAGQKFEKSTLAWLSEFLKMFRIINSCRTELTVLSVSKPEGDGVMVVVDSDHAHLLLNMCIAIMEQVTEAAAPRDGQPKGEIDISVAMGLATGKAFRYRPEEGGVDHLSPVCDRAARLCSAASAHAILVDTNTVDTANMSRVQSKLGGFLHRTPEQYRGQRERVQLKGIPDPVEYHEIFYGQTLYGLRASAVTEVTGTTRPPASTPTLKTVPVSATATATTEQRNGKVKVWYPDRGYGFITDPAGEDFHVSARAVFYEDDCHHLSVTGAEVVFLTAPPVTEGKSRRAVNVLVIGQRADGVIRLIHPEKPFGFIDVTDERSLRMSFHFFVSDQIRGQFKVGDEVSFEVATGTKGARAVNIDRIADAPSVAA